MTSDGRSGLSCNMAYPATTVTSQNSIGPFTRLQKRACAHGISDHLANDTPTPNGAAERPLIFVLGNFVSAIDTAALVAVWATFGGPRPSWSWRADSSILTRAIYLEYCLVTTAMLRLIALSPDAITLRTPLREITKPVSNEQNKSNLPQNNLE